MPVSTNAREKVRTKLTANAPGDVWEREADRVAEQVMRTPDAPRGARDCRGECQEYQPEQARPERLQASPARGAEAGGAEAPPIVEEVLRSPGQPLDGETRAFMEPRFGRDFSRVRVHTGARAGESAEALGALAYAAGRHLVFGPGQYSPGSEHTRRLVAHELAHVVQSGATAGTVFRQRAPGSASRLRTILNRMGTAARFLQSQRRRDMLGSIRAILGAFIPGGFGTKDSAGVETRPSAVAPIEVNVSRGGRYRHEVRLFISEEVPGRPLLGEYVGGRGRGVITMYAANLTGASDADIGDVLMHETVHLYNDVVRNASLGGNQATAAGTPAAPQRPVSVGELRYFDVTLGAGRISGSPHHHAIATAYEPLVQFLNRTRAGRGEPSLGTPALIADGWARSTVDEILAFLFSESATGALHRAGRSGQSRVTLGLTPEEFVANYARHLWLRESQDRAALGTPAGRQLLLQVSQNASLRALFSEIERWLDAPTFQAPGAGSRRP